MCLESQMRLFRMFICLCLLDNFDVVVGGINKDAPDDTVGPEIKLFMNDESFIEGGNTNVSPNLIAVLSDPSGINTSLTAVDHDIVGILDGDNTNPIILNDFYQFKKTTLYHLYIL